MMYFMFFSGMTAGMMLGAAITMWCYRQRK
jgi:hypothetical protein